MSQNFGTRFITELDGRPLRWTYLRPGLPKSASAYEQAADAFHVGVFDGETLVGCASMLLEDQSAGVTPGHWRLRGMVTHPEWRGRSVGSQALTFGVAELERRQATLVWCDGRTAALAFYRRHGFHPVGAEFETPGTGPHYRLIRPLAPVTSPASPKEPQ